MVKIINSIHLQKKKKKKKNSTKEKDSLDDSFLLKHKQSSKRKTTKLQNFTLQESNKKNFPPKKAFSRWLDPFRTRAIFKKHSHKITISTRRNEIINSIEDPEKKNL